MWQISVNTISLIRLQLTRSVRQNMNENGWFKRPKEVVTKSGYRNRPILLHFNRIIFSPIDLNSYHQWLCNRKPYPKENQCSNVKELRFTM